MKIPVKLVSSLSEEQINELKEVVKQSPNSRCRTRAPAILLSSENFSIDQISQICDIGRDAVSTWIDHWEQLGIKGLSDLPRPGGPGLLTDSEKPLLLELAAREPRSMVTLRAQLVDLTGKRVSPSTITRILKAAGYVWKRIKNPERPTPWGGVWSGTGGTSRVETTTSRRWHRTLVLWWLGFWWTTQCSLCLATSRFSFGSSSQANYTHQCFGFFDPG